MDDLIKRLRQHEDPVHYTDHLTMEAADAIELYAAEMSAAKEAGFYSAQELFDAYQKQNARVAELERNLQNIMDDDLKAQTLVEQEMEIGRLESQLDTLRKQEPVMIVKRGVNAFTFFDSTGLQGCDELPDGTPLYTLNPSTTHSASLKEKK